MHCLALVGTALGPSDIFQISLDRISRNATEGVPYHYPVIASLTFITKC
jgi:hypothetical protein